MSDKNPREESGAVRKESETVKGVDASTFRKPIKDLKVPKPITLEMGSSVQEALTMMQVKQFGCVLITKDEKLAGILSERDIIAKALGEDVHPATIKVEDIMTPNPEWFQLDDSIAFAMTAMVMGGYRHVPVVDENSIPVALVSVKDILGFIVEHFSQEILDLSPGTARRKDVSPGK